LAESGELLAQCHEGFWAPMDTLKDNQWLETMHERGEAPWALWNADRVSAGAEALVGSG
jgi:glucose-1-phosphate cytidylyltransferase